MAGTKSSGRPGGNPDLVKYQFEAGQAESHTHLLALRITASDYEKIKALPDWQDKVRQSIKALIAE